MSKHDISPFRFLETSGRYIVDKPITAHDIIKQACLLVSDQLLPGIEISGPKSVKDWLVLNLATLEYEVFGVIYLNTRHRVIGHTELFRGTIDGCTVHSREVVKTALQENAAAVIFFHNHPSCDGSPSQSDQRLTQRLKDALALVDIRTLDHMIVGGIDIVSMAERGLM